MLLKKDSLLSLVPITVRKDKKNYIVEDSVHGEFYEMPEMAVEAIGLLKKGKNLDEAEAYLQNKYPGEEVDMIDFANQLLELGLVSTIDGAGIVNEDSLPKKTGKVSAEGFTWISPAIGKLAFNRLTLTLYTLLFLINIILVIKNPQLFPNYRDYFVFSWMSLNVLLWIGIGIVLLLIHEMGHILAMRSNNLPTRLSIGHRLMFLALETDMEGAWKLSPGKRNVLYLGGLCFDTVLLFAALIIQTLYPNGPWLLIGISRIIVIDIFIRVAFQCGVYMKTDLYFVLESVTGSYNLMENANHFIKSIIQKQERQAGEVSYQEEKRTIAWYSVIYCLGILLTILTFVFYSVPQIVFMLKRSFDRLGSPLFSHTFFDGAIVLLETLGGLGILFYSWFKKYLRQQK